MDDPKLRELRQARDQWERDVLEPTLKRLPERQASFETPSGIPLKRMYDPEDIAQLDYLRDIGYPGQYPFTRGVQPTMYRGRFWTMRQYSGYATAKETNRRWHYLLQQGQTGLSCAFDLPTQMGYDADHEMAAGEVGKVGVSICSLEDMEDLMEGIPIERVSTSMTINATASILLAMYIAVAKRRGVDSSQLAGTVQNDILKEYMARGTFIFPPKPSMRLVTDIIAYCARHLPKWNSISISGYHIREAGATAVQEVAFTLANGIAYVEHTLAKGLEIDDFAPRLAFFFNAHNNFLEEIAKFRAARRLWARIMKERFGARDPRSLMLRFHTQTAGSSLTAQQPENNIVRTTIQALAAVLGGTQSLHTNSMDEALSLPTEKAARIALRTQQIIAYESGVADVIDPLAGSYYVEWLTDEIEQRAQQYLDRIDAMGGTLKALETGFFHKEIQESAYRYQQQVEEKKCIVVGVNEFTIEEPQPVETLKVDPAIREVQVQRLRELRQHRDRRKANELLERLKSAAAADDNLMPYIIDCVEGLCTLGEISDALRDVFGTYRDPGVV